MYRLQDLGIKFP